jgi:hypothetical protein
MIVSKEHEVAARFVTGDLSPEDFKKALVEDAELADWLCQREPPGFARRQATAYEFLVGLDPADPFSVEDARLCAQAALRADGVEAALSSDAADLMRAIGRVRPKWVDVPAPVLKSMILSSGGPRAEGLVRRVTQEVEQRYACLGKKPRWIQGPRWPHDEAGVPYTFVGQLPLGGIGHDDAVVYVFTDRRGAFVCVSQSM